MGATDGGDQSAGQPSDEPLLLETAKQKNSNSFGAGSSGNSAKINDISFITTCMENYIHCLY
jgi:hypothetical protein